MWLLRGLVCASQHEGEGKAVLVTGCDTGIGHEVVFLSVECVILSCHQVARHLDTLGCYVFAGCQNTASEGAQRLRVEASPRLQLVNLDLTQPEQALHYIVLPYPDHDLYRSMLPCGSCPRPCLPAAPASGPWSTTPATASVGSSTGRQPSRFTDRWVKSRQQASVCMIVVWSAFLFVGCATIQENDIFTSVLFYILITAF